jgi:hypothetical protein
MSRTTSDPFTIGNVVSAGVRLYRDRLGAYFSIAFTAVLWWLLPLLLIVLALMFAGAIGAGFLIFSLIIIVGIIIWLYGIAKSLAHTALISKLAFGHLTNQPEAISEARQSIVSRMWMFLWVQILLNLFLLIVNIGLSLGQTLLAGIVSLALSESSVIGGLLVFAINIAFLIIYLWVYSHFFIPEVPLAIERNMNSGEALSRSWNLATGSIWRIQGIIIVTTLVTLPIYALSALPMIFAFIQVVGANLQGNLEQEITQMPVSISLSIIATIVLFGIVNIFVVPLWQSIKAVIYYDLCSRREGLDLELRK